MVPKPQYPLTVTILMPAYNVQPFIKAAIRSVQLQSFQDWELIIINDGSSDRTKEIVDTEAQDDPRIHSLSLKQNAGPAVARNHGLKHAKGRYIAFLDADDQWLPQKLEVQIAFMRAQNMAFSYTGFWRKKAHHSYIVDVPATTTRAELLRGNIIGCLTAIYDRAQLGDMPMPLLKRRQDYALWLDILQRIPKAYGLQEPLATYTEHRGSLSSNRWAATFATWQLYRNHVGLSVWQSLRCLHSHLSKRLFRGLFQLRAK